MRWIAALVLTASCAVGVDADEVATNAVCVEAAGETACAEDLEVSGDATAVSAAGQALANDVELGFERVDVAVELEPDGDGWSVASAELPVIVDCIVDIAHGDHCHLGIPSRRSCAVPVSGSDFRRVRSESDGGEVVISFTAEWDGAAPECCAHTCAESTRVPTAEPAGPYVLRGVVRATLP